MTTVHMQEVSIQTPFTFAKPLESFFLIIAL